MSVPSVAVNPDENTYNNMIESLVSRRKKKNTQTHINVENNSSTTEIPLLLKSERELPEHDHLRCDFAGCDINVKYYLV